MQAARDNSWVAAIGAAGAQVQRLRDEARDQALKEAQKPMRWADVAAEAAANAARPYLQTVRQAQQVAEQWHVAAQDELDRAEMLRGPAQAAQLEQAGNAGE